MWFGCQLPVDWFYTEFQDSNTAEHQTRREPLRNRTVHVPVRLAVTLSSCEKPTQDARGPPPAEPF